MTRILTLKVICLTVAFALVIASYCHAGDKDKTHAEESWKLINTEPGGNRTYINTSSLDRLDNSVVRVIMKFVSEKNDSDMYFLDELDCRRGLIKRLSVSLKGPPCTGGIDYDASFEGKWDKISTGLEEKLRDAICAEEEEHPDTVDASK